LLVSVHNQAGAAYLVGGDGSRRKIRENVASVRRSPDGRWITYLEATGRRVRGYSVLRLVSSRPDGRDRTVLRVPQGTGAPYSVAAYDWSPDSRRLALALSDFGGESFAGNPVPGILAVARRDGSAMRRLAPCEAGNGPEWSPDGRQIAYSCLYGRVNVVSGVGRPRVDAIFGARAPASVGGASIAWRPDGRQIAYATARTAAGGYRITLLSADGTVRPARRNATTMVWSPDGAHYAYMTEPATWRDPRFLVIARATDGHRERRVRLAAGDTIDWYR
jgi:Tol biopolymer transport system component